MIIAIEGMDGVGKTTCANLLAKKLHYPYVSHPLQYFFKNGKANLELHNCLSNMYKMHPEIRAWFIGLGNLYVGKMYKNAVLDRHLASNFFWNGTETSRPVFETIINMIGKPDLTILLHATAEVRRQRIHERDVFDRDLTDAEKWVDGYPKMEAFLTDFNIPYVKIYTDGKNADTVCKEALLEVSKIIASKHLSEKSSIRILKGKTYQKEYE